ncbi:MAG: DUF3048 domain-containing protein [Chloroflexota bacterium]
MGKSLKGQIQLDVKAIGIVVIYFICQILFAVGCNWIASSPNSSTADTSSFSESSASTDDTDFTSQNSSLSVGISDLAVPAEQEMGTDERGATADSSATNLSNQNVLTARKTISDDANLRVADLIAQAVTVTQRATVGDLLSTSPQESKSVGELDSVEESGLGAQTEPRSELSAEWTGQVDGELVNIRSGPTTIASVTGQASRGASLTILGQSEDGLWWQVCCPSNQNEAGWIFGELVKLSAATIAETALIPVVVVPGLPVETTSVQAGTQVPAASGGQASPVVAGPAPGLPGNGGFGTPGGINPLTGLPLPSGRNGQRPLIVCINNDFAARPQMGTSQADVMYEYLMEGYGITRFSGVFYGDDVAQIGPIRSARLINNYMGVLYDGGLVCSGASDPVRYILKHQVPFPYLDIDLDDPSNSRYTTNVGSDYRTRLRTDTGKLRRWLADWGSEKPGALRGFTFGSYPEGGTPATTISIPYPGINSVSYQHNGNGQYLRFLGGTPHIDGNGSGQLKFENVIVQYVSHETTDIVEDSLGSLSIRLNLFGSGRAILFRDGMAFDGSWRSDSGGDMPRFFSSNGQEVPLKAGRSWISVVPASYAISYQ